MRIVDSKKITEAVKDMSIESNYFLNEDVVNKIKESYLEEKNSISKEILRDMLENLDIAKKDNIPICQDTGMVVVFVDIGDNIYIKGNIEDAINEGIRQGYKEGYLRNSVVKDPLERINTEDNTPAVIHYSFVKGEKIKIILAPKGFGSENMSGLKMLKPSDGKEGVKKFVIDTVKSAGPNHCPPIIVGVGIGGTMDKASQIAKKALFRNLNETNKKQHLDELEREILEEINKLDIGPQGFGGNTTALAVNIESFPTHIAGLPVAVNINCHVSRHKEVIIEGDEF